MFVAWQPKSMEIPFLTKTPAFVAMATFIPRNIQYMFSDVKTNY